MYTIARGFYGIYLSQSEVTMMYQRWLATEADADAPDTSELDEDDNASDWLVGQAEAAGLEAAFGTWYADADDEDPEGLYYVHLPSAPQLEGTLAALADQLDQLRAVDPTPLKQFCSETLRFDSAPAAEYRVLQVCE